jgi:hypothetical protein
VLVLVGTAAGLGVGFSFIHHGARTAHATRAAKPALSVPHFRVLPSEVRGIHVTMGLASLPGKVDDYMKLQAFGLNTLELDVKDENGYIGWVPRSVPLARAIGAARPYYEPRALARRAHDRGLYLIGRVVVFEDPVLSEARPQLALHNPDGSVWHTRGGLGWVNQYDRRVWKYNVGIAVAAARAGFDEIQFDYVRFPSDGDVSSIVYPVKRSEPRGTTIASFLRYATSQLHPLGVRVSAAVFGLAATRDLRIGQVPRRIASILDAVYPMAYPSHFGPGQYSIPDPNAEPGRTVARALRDFRIQMRGSRAKLIPWLQDFSLGRPYSLADVAQQITAARSQHARGFLLWNAEGIYSDAALAGR